VYNVFGNAGALVGPLLGAALLSVDFRLIAAIAAAVFAVLTAAQLIALPRQPRIEHHDRVVGSWGLVLRNRRFLIFTLGGCAYFALFNQLYLALPIEAERVTGNPQSVSVVFVVSTVLGIGLQMPVTAVARRLLRPGSAAGLGVGLMGAAFVPLAVSAPILDTAAESRPIAGWLTLLWPVILTTAVFSIGIALANPYIMELLGVVGEDRLSGTYYGWFYLVSAVASLVVGSVVGRALDITEPSWRALPFVVLAAVGAVGSAIVAEMTRRNLLQEQSVTARS